MRYRYSAGKNGKLEKKAAIYTCDEHGINFANVDSEAVTIVKKLKNAGFETYIVGGAVRDLVLGKKPKDFDIVSAASPAKIKRIFYNSRIIGRRFRLVHVYFGQKVFEVSTFRSLKDGHTGNTFGSIDEDVFRRDFSMNALFYDPEQQIVVDYVGGMKDIKKRQVRPIIPLSEIFTDDPVRMIRAAKYAAVTGFSLPLNVRLKIKWQSGLITAISPSRLTEEIFKIIHSDKAAVIVELLDKLGVYCYLQPKAAELMRTKPAFREKYLRTMAALNGTEKFRGQSLGALFTDYLEGTRDWQPGVVENYKEIFQTARSFVLPMNPPRVELDHALRRFLAGHNITIKRQHIHAKPKPASGASGNNLQESETKPSVAGRKRRRRKSRVKEKQN